MPIRNLSRGEMEVTQHEDDNGRIHRVGGPARITLYVFWNTYEWYNHGKMHRTDGPAFINSPLFGVGIIMYKQMNKPHRVDGPAIIKFTVTRCNETYARTATIKTAIWYINGKKIHPHVVQNMLREYSRAINSLPLPIAEEILEEATFGKLIEYFQYPYFELAAAVE